MEKDKKSLIKKGIKIVGKLIFILSLVFVARAVYVLGFDFDSVENWPVFLAVTFVCAFVKCITVYISGSSWYGWLSFFSGKKGQLKEGLCVYAKANIGKYLPGNVMHYVERNLFADKLGISQKKLAASSIFEVLSLVSVALIMAFVVSLNQLESALKSVLGEHYLRIILCVALAGVVFLALILFLFWKKLAPILAGYRLKDFLAMLFLNLLRYGIVLVLLGILMVVLYCYMGGVFTWRKACLIVSGYIIAWVLGFIVPGAPGGIGVRELVITLLLGSVVGENLIVSLSITHRLITIVGDFMAYLVMLFIRKTSKSA